MADAWVDITPEGGWPWESVAPGPALAAVLAAVDPGSLPDSARVSLLKSCEALAGWAAVLSGRALIGVEDAAEAVADELGTPVERREAWLGDELAAALRVASTTAASRASTARQLLRRWPALGGAVAAGEITWSQGRAIAEAVWALDGVIGPDGRDLSEVAVARLLPTAGRYAPGRLGKRAAGLVLALDPEAAGRRRRRAQRDRVDVDMYPEPDGLGMLWARGPAADAVAMKQAVTARATALRAAATDPRARTAGQWRLVALMAALGLAPQPGDPGCDHDGQPASCEPDPLDPDTVDPDPLDPDPLDPATVVETEPAAGSADPVPQVPGVRVSVVVDLPTLLGLAEDPGHLEGFGPIDPDLARALAADADWTRWVTDPVTGHLLDAGDRRLPPAGLRRFVHHRQTRCHHPTCGVGSARCDTDHVPAYRDTHHTRASELAPGCPRHNQQRDHHGWTAGPEPDPAMADPYAAPEPIWTSPLGRSYRSLTDPALPFTTAPVPAGMRSGFADPADDPPPF